MDVDQASRFALRAALIVLKRKPTRDEMESFTGALISTSPMDFLDRLEILAASAPSSEVATHWPHGHYYSPVVNPDQSVHHYWSKEQDTFPHDIEGIKLDLPAMMEFWNRNAEFLLGHPFPDQASNDFRYGQDNGSFPGGDAVFVGAIMRSFAPKHIIEIGSGNSTACMLDWRDRLGMQDLRVTCIEPDPVRVRRILRPTDRITLIESAVQDVDLSVFDTLESGDILFIDSTHVLKTGSDVHHELFHILPRLRQGVIIHFHDCAYPLEYPREAVFDMNFSWNEAYAVRAFLMYNSHFEVLFWNSMFYRFCEPAVREAFNTLSRNPGGGFWLRKTDAG